MMGFSTGGLVAVDYALNYPDDCQGLILVTTAHRGTGALASFLSSALAPPAPAKRAIPFLVYDVDPRAAVQLGSDILGYDAPAHRITRPVVIVVGDRDGFFPVATVNELVRQLATPPFGCRYRVIPGGTHGIPYSHTEKIEQFIAENLDYLVSN